MIRTKAYFAPTIVIAFAALLNAQAPLQVNKLQAETRSSSGRVPVVGAWIARVVPDVPPGAPAFTNYVLHTYSSDGSVISIGTPLTSPVPAIQNLGNQLSGAVGEWVWLGNRQFMETIVALIFKDGTPGGFQRTRVISTLDETLNGFTATSVVDFIDLKGNVVATGTAKATGTRVTWVP